MLCSSEINAKSPEQGSSSQNPDSPNTLLVSIGGVMYKSSPFQVMEPGSERALSRIEGVSILDHGHDPVESIQDAEADQRPASTQHS